jgi:hypothetical protein
VLARRVGRSVRPSVLACYTARIMSVASTGADCTLWERDKHSVQMRTREGTHVLSPHKSVRRRVLVKALPRTSQGAQLRFLLLVVSIGFLPLYLLALVEVHLLPFALVNAFVIELIILPLVPCIRWAGRKLIRRRERREVLTNARMATRVRV